MARIGRLRGPAWRIVCTVGLILKRLEELEIVIDTAIFVLFLYHAKHVKTIVSGLSLILLFTILRVAEPRRIFLAPVARSLLLFRIKIRALVICSSLILLLFCNWQVLIRHWLPFVLLVLQALLNGHPAHLMILQTVQPLYRRGVKENAATVHVLLWLAELALANRVIILITDRPRQFLVQCLIRALVIQLLDSVGHELWLALHHHHGCVLRKLMLIDLGKSVIRRRVEL